MSARLDEREDYDEERWIGLGLLHNFVAVVVLIKKLVDVIRKATGHECRQYEKG